MEAKSEGEVSRVVSLCWLYLLVPVHPLCRLVFLSVSCEVFVSKSDETGRELSIWTE